MGFTIPEIDTVLAKYAELSYSSNLLFCKKYTQDFLQDTSEAMDEAVKEMALKMTVREIEQGVQGFETKLNTVSNSLGQIPFVTATFGLDTTEWGREISKAFLKVRKKGMGKKKTTAVFPKLVFLHRKEINGDKGSLNYDIKQAAIECSRTRLYPDYLSLDSGHLGEVFDRTGKAVSNMGCRAFLSPYLHEGEEIYIGRSNIGAVSLNLPKIALESKDWEEFRALISYYSEMVFEIHEDYYKKISKMKGSTNPLYFCEGGAWTSVGYDESVEKIYKASTASLGYIGINETLNVMKVFDSQKRVETGINIVQLLADIVSDASIRYDRLFALYSTPAESLCYRFQKINQNDYGIIPGITDREYMTNSFHIPVWEDITVPEKMIAEAPYHQIAKGGKISYNEFVYGVDSEVLEQAIDTAMKLGLYYGVNVVSTTCEGCGHSGDFRDCCPKCQSKNLTEVTRCCGLK